MKASITLIDDDNGAVKAECHFDDVFNVNSNAHQGIWLLMKHMDELGKRLDDEPQS